jgi:hypothetical protein
MRREAESQLTGGRYGEPRSGGGGEPPSIPGTRWKVNSARAQAQDAIYWLAERLKPLHDPLQRGCRETIRNLSPVGVD